MWLVEINVGVEPLVKALGEAIVLSYAERREMGARGRLLVAEKYTWDAVVKAMMKGYEEGSEVRGVVDGHRG